MGRLTALLATRLIQGIVVALAVATLCFAALQTLPGDLAFQVASARLGEGRAGELSTAALRHADGLDRPVAVQYAAWIGQLARGDAGRSLVTGRPVAAELAPRLAVTLSVGALGVLIAGLLAVPAGIAAGLRPGGLADRVVASLAALLASVPAFVVGAVLVAVLAVRLRWLPAAGSGDLRHALLPGASLGLALAPGLARIVRHGVAGVVSSAYVAFARMRGVAAWRIALLVAARPALLPVAAYVPVLAMQVFEGFVAIELVFNLDGVGSLLVRSLLARDIPVVAGIGIAAALLLSATILATDLVLSLLDPRPAAAAP